MNKFPFSVSKKTWSVSRLNTFMSCPRKYAFKYKWFVPEEKKFYLTRGIIFHETIASYLRSLYENNKQKKLFELNSSQAELESYTQNIAKAFDAMREKGEPVSDAKHSETSVLKLVQNAFQEYYDNINSLNKFKVLSYIDPSLEEPKPTIELEFRIPFVDINTMEPIPGIDSDLYGYIDLISYDNKNGLSVRDHKLHSSRYTEFELNVDLQLIMYAYVFKYLHKMKCFPELKEEMPDNLTVGLNSFLINKGISTKLEYSNITLDNKKIMQGVATAVDLIQSEPVIKPYPIFSDECNWMCSFKALCFKMQNGEDVSDQIANFKKEKESKILSSAINEIEKEELI